MSFDNSRILGSLILGTDIGITSIKISLLDVNQKTIIARNGIQYCFKQNNNFEKLSKIIQKKSVETIIDVCKKL